METLKGYANYGVLGQEKYIVFSESGECETATCSDKIEITMPEGYKIFENVMSDALIETPDGNTYLACEIIKGNSEGVYLNYYDGKQWYKTKTLEHKIID